MEDFWMGMYWGVAVGVIAQNAFWLWVIRRKERLDEECKY